MKVVIGTIDFVASQGPHIRDTEHALKNGDAFTHWSRTGKVVTFILYGEYGNAIDWLQGRILDTEAEYSMTVEGYTHGKTILDFSNVKDVD